VLRGFQVQIDRLFGPPEAQQQVIVAVEDQGPITGAS
jgi:hypothetical protein